MAQGTYEVYYHQNGRWHLHASFENGEREIAVGETTIVANKEGYTTRVVRETFDSEINTTENVVVWQSPEAKKMGDVNSMFGAGGKGTKKKGPQRGAAQYQRQAPQRGGPPSQAPNAAYSPKAGGPAKKKKKTVKKGAPRGKVKRRRKKKKQAALAALSWP